MARVLMMVVASAVSLLTMRACQSSGSSSTTDPSDVARTGVEGLCANQQAVTAAGSPDDSLSPVTLPPDLAAGLKGADPDAAALLSQATSCGAATTAP